MRVKEACLCIFIIIPGALKNMFYQLKVLFGAPYL